MRSCAAEPAGSRVAPAGDTGATAPAWGLHWLAVSLWGAEPEPVAELVAAAVLGRRLGLGGWQALGGARFYGRRWELIKGVTLLGEPQAPGASEHLHLVLPGEACEVVGAQGLLELLAQLRELAAQVRVVRLDVAVDHAPFSPVEAYAALMAGQVVCWAKRGRDGRVTHSWHEANGPGEGRTLYVGRRCSRRLLRIYDAHGFTRVELECKAEAAEALAWLLVERRGDGAALGRGVIGAIRAYCDFGVRSDGRHGARRLRLLSWWAAFVAGAERLGQLVVERRQRLSVDRTLGWLDRQVVPSLAMVLACYREQGWRLLEGWVASALPYLSARHRAAIAEFRAAYEVVA
jgi:hypothetical protein